MFKSLQNRPLAVYTPLGPDALLLRRFSGVTALSELFRFELELQGARPGIPAFDQVLGQPATVRIRQADGSHAFFTGLVSCLERVGQDRTHFHYRAVLVPRLWLLTKKIQSRIFQQKSVLDVLQTVLEPLRPDVEFKLQHREEYVSRDYCVQYQESDFAFASRLMEEEGLYYYFEHSDDGHKLIVTDNTTLLPAPAELSLLQYDDGDAGSRVGVRINSWRNRQELCSSSFTLWDQCFELADMQGRGFQTLEAKRRIAETVKAGAAEHNLNLEASRPLEVFDCQPGYAKCFDGISPDGAERPEQLSNIRQAAQWRAARRAEAEAASALRNGGASNVALLRPGHKFKLLGALEDSGQYYLTRVTHEASLGDDRSGGEAAFDYDNRFECLPVELPFRPPRVTPRPTIQGVQTATVVGPSAGETNAAPHLDKYGRIKVQFHWDRQRQFDGRSSCWLRVAQVWAGQRFGAFFWPRPGHEVVVAFENGDPDCPIVTGSVYNSVNMPPLPLPEGRYSCGFKSYTPGGDPNGEFACVVFHDQQNVEYLQIHSGMHEMSRTNATRARDTTGPTLETYGRLFMPLPGSGSGSGAAEQQEPPEKNIPKLGSVAGIFLAHGGDDRTAAGLNFLDLKGGVKNAINTSLLGLPGLADAFPAKAEYVIGDRLEISMFGKRETHQLWGENRTYNFAHPIDLLETLAQNYVATKQWGEKALMAYKLGMGLLTLGPEPSGTFEMALGKKTDFGYFGPFVEVKRGKKYAYEGQQFGPFVEGLIGKAAFFLTLAIYTAMSLADILLRRFHRGPDEGDVNFASHYFLGTNVAATKLAGLLFELECFNAKTEQGKEDAEKAAHASKASLVATTVGNMEMALVKLERATRSLGDVAEDLKDVTGVRNPSDASTRHAHIYADRYSLTAPDVKIAAREADAIAPTITVSATDDHGKVLVQGGGGDGAGVMLTTQNASSIMLTSSGGNPSIDVFNPSAGDIKLRVGLLPPAPKIEMKRDAITLECGLLGSSITFAPTSLELKVGAAASITLEQTGITLKLGDANTITLAPDGVSINGMQVNLSATVNAGVEALQLNLDGKAMLALKGAINQVG